jgi:tetraacyldisaccharide 4'-kinase
VLDDGLQSRQVEPDLAIAVVDGEVGIGNGLCLPAGPLRAPLAAQWPHINAVIVVGRGERGKSVAKIAAARRKPVLTASLVPKPGEAERFAGRPVVAFAGMGRPQKFFRLMEKIGADIRAWHSFADHHVYTRRELAQLIAQAQRLNAHLVTTEKDLMRLRRSTHPDGVDALAVELVFDEPEAIANLLRSALPCKTKA